MKSITKGDKMESKTLMFGLENEYEGTSTLWFEASNPEAILNYIKDNMDENKIYSFQLKKMTDDEINELEK